MRPLLEIWWWACYVYYEAASRYIDPLSPDVGHIVHTLAELRDKLGITPGAYE